MNKSVDIIIPIYNAFEELQVCLDSIYKNTDLINNRLILINDCSPDKRIRPFLDEQGKKTNSIIVIHNKSNNGFSANINVGLEQSLENDVILLNSDTIVTKNWVEKIIQCAYSDSSIATVTPLSNNATLCSVPAFCAENILPDNMSVDEAAAIVERCTFREYPDITVANGFCMFVKREVINIIGYFDAETFGRGYGEENDFCNRAEQVGFKHVMCDDTYIFHSGTKSFVSKEKEEYIKLHDKILYQRYPHQMLKNAIHCRDNPNKNIGKNIQIYFELFNHKKNLLILVQSDFRSSASDNIGGTQLHVRDLVYSLRNKFNVFVVARDRDDLAVSAYIEEKEILFRYNMPFEREYPVFKEKRLSYFWENILLAFKINIVHVHHLNKMSFDVFDVARSLNIPILFTLHDFYFICPTIKLLDDKERMCVGKDSAEKCNLCLQKQMQFLPTLNYISVWRSKCELYLKMVDTIVVPSNSAKEILIQYYPNLNSKTIVIEHGYETQSNIKLNHIAGDKIGEIIARFEKVSRVGGGYCAEGWAYINESNSSENEIWLEIKNEKEKRCLIPTTVVSRPDVTTEVANNNCGFRGFIPKWICNEKKLTLQIYIKTPEGFVKDLQEYNITIKPLENDSKLNVAFIGGLNIAKGGGKAAQIIKYGPREVEWYVFGGIGVEALETLEKNNLVKTGYYKPCQLPTLLKEHRIDLICILSLWPETYSYTLTEAILNRIPVIVSNVGALGGRTVENDFGWVVDIIDLEDNTIRLISSILSRKDILENKKQILSHVSIKSLDEMAREYEKLYDKSFCENIFNKPFDSKYVYQGFLRGTYYNQCYETISEIDKKILENAKSELMSLKASLSYKVIMRIRKSRFPFKQTIKKIIKNRKK